MNKTDSNVEFPLKLLGFVVFMIAWYLCSNEYHSLILPSPQETFVRLHAIFANENGIDHVGITILRALVGFLVCVVSATILGTLSGLFEQIRAFVHPIERLMISIPPIAWVVLTVIWFGGSGVGSAVTTIAVASFPVLYMSVQQGVKTLDKGLIDMGRSFGMSRIRATLRIGAVHVLSVAFPALTIVFGQSWKLAVMAEVFGANNGVGAMITMAQVNLETVDVFAWITVSVVMFFISDKILIEPINEYSMKWR